MRRSAASHWSSGYRLGLAQPASCLHPLRRSCPRRESCGTAAHRCNTHRRMRLFRSPQWVQKVPVVKKKKNIHWYIPFHIALFYAHCKKLKFKKDLGKKWKTWPRKGRRDSRQIQDRTRMTFGPRLPLVSETPAGGGSHAECMLS